MPLQITSVQYFEMCLIAENKLNYIDVQTVFQLYYIYLISKKNVLGWFHPISKFIKSHIYVALLLLVFGMGKYSLSIYRNIVDRPPASCRYWRIARYMIKAGYHKVDLSGSMLIT